MTLGGAYAAAASACLAWLVLTGIVYLVIFWADRRHAANAWLAAAALCVSMYPLWALGVAPSMFGAHAVQVLSAAIITGCIASVHFTRSRFGLPRPSLVWVGLLGVAGVLAVIAPSRRHLIELTSFAAAITVVEQLVTLTRVCRSKAGARNAGMLLACWGILGVAGALDLAAWVSIVDVPGLIGTKSMTLFGLTAFAFLHTMALAREHLASLNQNEHLRGELEAQVRTLRDSHREIEVLNQELRRQVGLRSSQLAEALSRLSDADSEDVALQPGAIIGSRYRVMSELGRGAMGSVYEVERTSDGQSFALKVLNGKASPEALARFAREGHILSELNHPNLLSLVDVDVSNTGTLFLVTDLVRGASLDKRRRNWGDSEWALPIVHQIAEGLSAMHGIGVVHRDLKPANILVTRSAGDDLSIKIADFGVASLDGRAADRDTLPLGPKGAHVVALADTAQHIRRLTATGIVIGTPDYMAPELADGNYSASSASDVFSFGILAYELLSGASPFRDPPFAQRLCGLSPEPRAPLAELCPELSVRITKIVDRCLSAEPADRPDAAEIAEAFAPARRAVGAPISSLLTATTTH